MSLPSDLDRANRELLEGPKVSRECGTEHAPQSVAVPLPPPPAKIPPILLLGFEGKSLELYCSARIDCQFLNVPMQPNGLLAEQYLESLLPKRHREQFFPGYLRHRFELEPLTPSTVAERVARSEAIQRLRRDGLVFTASQLQRIVCGGVE